MSYNANGLLNSDGSVTQYGNTRSSGGSGGGGSDTLHETWLIDYKTFGEESYVFNDKDILNELYSDYDLCANDMAIVGEVLTYCVGLQSNVGEFISNCYGVTNPDTLLSISTLNDLLSSSSAMTNVANSYMAVSALVSTQALANALKASSTALNACMSTVAGFTALLNSPYMKSTFTWSSASDSIISGMVQQADAGNIELSNYWSINDERIVSLSAISSSGTYDGTSWSVGENQSAQNVTLVLMDTDKYDLVTATSGGKTKSTFVIGMKDAMYTRGYMNASNTSVGSWASCKRRQWCNGGFRSALPSTLRGIFKQFKTPTINEYNGSAIVYSSDYFALWAEKEVFGSQANSNATEAEALTQISYYTTASNRIKKSNNYNYYWWERSPYYADNVYFCAVNSSGIVNVSAATNAFGISVFGCI